MEDLLRGYQPIQESPKKILCGWMGGLEIKEVWRPSTSCNLFITSFTFSPCLPLVREGIWLNTGSNKNHRRKQDNRSHKNKAIKACFFARVCLLISSRAIYERCLWLLHTSSWATADGATGNSPGLAKRRLSLDRRIPDICHFFYTGKIFGE